MMNLDLFRCLLVAVPNSSPCPSPAFPEKGAKGGQSDLKNSKKPLTSSRQKQNSTSSSYDINNIVIPYSMAAASRVELIQYKEIPTPKWRIEEILPLPLSQKNDADAEEIEDISDEAIVVRHRKSEIDEHKKYLNYYNSLSKASRSSRTRRADSSGTNTPDNPLSPRPSESLLECSPVGSPDTPLTPQYELIAENPSTVLTLSLSSLKSSLLKTDHHLSLESEELNNSSNCNLSSLKCQPKTLSAPPSSCVLESSEAPLPALRTRRSHSTNITNLAHPLEKPRLSSLSEEQSEKESGRGSPLSELTDSAPEQEEEGSWEEGASATPPDWTISAVNDQCGGFVLTVQKN
ncbi:KAT8 regulatory NSL complex subunit 1-like protein [Armadillidium vulgare]|nr:KAT8 regulatory NSL complex subunit 1-like protein [Armadillidium vulgare]